MTDFRAWFRYRDEHGLDEAGNLAPIADLGINIPQVTLVGGHVIESTGRNVTAPVADALSDDIHTRVVPHSRVIETSSHAVANVLAAYESLFEMIDPPTKGELKAAADETKDAREAQTIREQAAKAGSIEAPDSTDPGGGTQPVASGAVAIPRVPAVFTADERLELDRAIKAKEIDGDDRFATWVAATPVDALLSEVEGRIAGPKPEGGIADPDYLFAKRILIAEQTRADTRKTLVDKLAPIVETNS